MSSITEAANILKKAYRVTAFTGAGISVESGIPPFRGENGLWSKFDPVFLDLDYFHSYPEKSWKLIKEIFYEFFGKAKPNKAHYVLAEMEEKKILHDIITQNIDNLHQEAGSRHVVEFHGTSQRLICTQCSKIFSGQNTVTKLVQHTPYPVCTDCGGLLKPDFIFFGEGIPDKAYKQSIDDTIHSDVFFLIGTTGEIQPASVIPVTAKKNKALIIEINIEPSRYTESITDIFLQGKATEIMMQLEKELVI